MAEIDRLEAIFQKQGDTDKLARVNALRKKHKAQFEKSMQRYEDALGAEEYKKLRKRVGLAD